MVTFALGRTVYPHNKAYITLKTTDDGLNTVA